MGPGASVSQQSAIWRIVSRGYTPVSRPCGSAGIPLLVALLLFIAGDEMFGPIAGLIAMALWVFDPTVLTNAPFVTTDTELLSASSQVLTLSTNSSSR